MAANTRPRRTVKLALGLLVATVVVTIATLWWHWEDIAYHDWQLGHEGGHLVQSPSHRRVSVPKETGERFFFFRTKKESWLPGPDLLVHPIAQNDWDEIARDPDVVLSREAAEEYTPEPSSKASRRLNVSLNPPPGPASK